MTKRFTSVCTAALLFSLGVPDVSDAFTSRRGTRVNPVNDAVFEVIPRGASNAGDFWCAAGDYAQRALGQPWTSRVYVARGRGPSVTTGRRSAVQFTVNPSGAGITPIESSISLNSMKPGESMSVQVAFGYCNSHPGRP